MIDIHTETLVTLAEAANRLPRRPNAVTLWRWWKKGVRGGVRLETKKIGGIRYTSIEALDRFVARTNEPDEPVAMQTPAQRRRLIEDAVRELEEAGI